MENKHLGKFTQLTKRNTAFATQVKFKFGR